jgi:DNA polymerase III sliding clamp (beta) subunit (PCNA family)
VKARVTKKDLLSALDKCGNAQGKTSGHSCSGKILLSAIKGIGDDGSVLQCYANDLVLSVDTAIDSDVEVEGQVGVETKRLHSVVNSLGDGSVALSLSGTKLVVAAAGKGSRKYQLPTLDIGAFPKSVNPESGSASIEVAPELLAALISHVKYAMAPDGQSHPANFVIQLYTDTGMLVAVSTDNQRLARYQAEFATDAVWTCPLPGALIPVVAAMCKTASKEAVRLIECGNTLYAETDDTLVGSLRPAGALPPLKMVMEKQELRPVCKLSSAALSESIRAVTAASGSNADNSAVRLTLAGSDKSSLLVTLIDSDATAEDTVPVDSISDEAFSVIYNPRLMLDGLKVADDEVVLNATDMGMGAIALVLTCGQHYLAWSSPQVRD